MRFMNNTLLALFALSLGGLTLAGMISLATASSARLHEVEPVVAPFAHTRFCLRYPDECKETDDTDKDEPVPLSPQRRDELASVNNRVNASITERRQNADPAFENWVIGPSAGDCNDYAVTKQHLLVRKGWPKHALLLAEAKLHSGEHHLVLVARTSDGDLVLDNMRSEMRSVDQAGADYRWVRMQSKDDPRFWSKVEPSP